MRLGRAILFAKDFERMLNFYRDSLGLRLVGGQDAPGWAELEAGGARLALHAIPNDVAQGITVASPPRPREDTAIKLVFVVSDFGQSVPGSFRSASVCQTCVHGVVATESIRKATCSRLRTDSRLMREPSNNAS